MFTAKRNPVTRFFSEAARSISFASQVDRIASTPDHVFQARGTTRQRELRNLLDQF